MKHFISTIQAERDMDGIWNYTEEHWGVEQAKKYTEIIRKTCADIAAGKLKGRNIDEIRQGYFRYSVGSHVLFYRIHDGNIVELMRILHGRMDVMSRL
jgi:toxin ParE1/3/4